MAPRWGRPRWNFAEIFGIKKLESLRYRIRRCFCDPRFSRFGTIPACDRRTDGRTDRRTQDDNIYRTSVASRSKNLDFYR